MGVGGGKKREDERGKTAHRGRELEREYVSPYISLPIDSSDIHTHSLPLSPPENEGGKKIGIH
jgi:hypothetical protein